MAQLKNLDKIWTAPIGHTVTVGNNRTIERTETDTFTCRLHGAPIAVMRPHGASGDVSVNLNACGWLTTTTIAAMTDFMGAFGIAGSASRAGGKLSARWYSFSGWTERTSPDGETLSLCAQRNPVLD